MKEGKREIGRASGVRERKEGWSGVEGKVERKRENEEYRGKPGEEGQVQFYNKLNRS